MTLGNLTCFLVPRPHRGVVGFHTAILLARVSCVPLLFPHPTVSVCAGCLEPGWQEVRAP